MGDLKSMDNILEVGAGTGSIFPVVILNKKKDAQYTCIDISKEFMQAAAQRLQILENNYKNQNYMSSNLMQQIQIPKEKPENYEFKSEYFNMKIKEMNIEKLDFPNETFDGYFESFVIHHCSWEKCLSEAHRVLKKNGRICLAEFSPEDTSMECMLQKDQEVEQWLEQLYGKDFRKQSNCHSGSCGEQHPEAEGSEKSDKDKKQLEVGEDLGWDNVWGEQKIREYLEKLGFENIIIFKQYVTMYVSKENCIAHYLDGEIKDVKIQLGKEEAEAITEKIYNKVIFEINSKKPRGYSALAIIATKK